MPSIGPLVSLLPVGCSPPAFLADAAWEVRHVENDDATTLPQLDVDCRAVALRLWTRTSPNQPQEGSNNATAVSPSRSGGLGGRYLAVDEVAGAVVLAEAPTVWELRCYGGLEVSLACLLPKSKQRMYLRWQRLLPPALAADATGLELVREAAAASVLCLRTLQAPVVDIGPLLAGASEADAYDATQALMDAAQDNGYFFICGCPALEAAAGAATAALQQLYGASPLAQQFEKTTLRSSTGEVKVSAVPPRFEPIRVPPWALPAEDAAAAYFCEGMRAGRAIVSALRQHPDDPLYGLLRCVGYPAGPHADRSENSALYLASTGGLEEHTDKTWVTLLAASRIGGLQFAEADTSFASVCAPSDAGYALGSGALPPSATILVNIGDAMEAASGGAFISRLHRARNVRSDNVRVSLPLFVEPAHGAWPADVRRLHTQVFDL